MTEVTDVDRANVTHVPREDPAVVRMLTLADEAAARGDYDAALACLRRVAARGHLLDRSYETRCAAWQLHAENARVGCSRWFG